VEEKKIAIYAGIGLVILLFVIVLIPSSKKNTIDTLGSDFFGASNTTTSANITELTAQDLTMGTGERSVKAGDSVSIHYIGSFTTGQKFESSYERRQPYTFEVGKGSVMPGVEQGIIGMKIGGKRKLTIPANLAYGEKGNGPVGPNTPIIFEIELLDIKDPIALPNEPIIRIASPTPEATPEPTPEESVSPTPEP
jgi:hypothetical protein